MKCDYEPRIPSIKGVMKANRMDIPTVDLTALGLTVDTVGASGSPTRLERTWRNPKKQGGIKIDGTANAQAAVEQLTAYLQEQKIL
jgi:electron transfer flavoprotein beta subunit